MQKNCILINLLSNRIYSIGAKKRRIVEAKKQVDLENIFADIPVEHVLQLRIHKKSLNFCTNKAHLICLTQFRFLNAF